MSNKNVGVDKFEKIVNDYSDTILRIAYHYTGNIHDSEDIAQEVFVSVLQKDFSDYSPERLKAYIIRVAINKCNSWHRQRKRNEVIPLDSVSTQLTAEEKSVLGEVCALPEKYRNVIYLYYYEGYSIKEISEILRTNENTVGSRLRRARAQLKTLLTEENYE